MSNPFARNEFTAQGFGQQGGYQQGGYQQGGYQQGFAQQGGYTPGQYQGAPQQPYGQWNPQGGYGGQGGFPQGAPQQGGKSKTPLIIGIIAGVVVIAIIVGVVIWAMSGSDSEDSSDNSYPAPGQWQRKPGEPRPRQPSGAEQHQPLRRTRAGEWNGSQRHAQHDSRRVQLPLRDDRHLVRTQGRQ